MYNTHLGSGNPKRKRLRIYRYPKCVNINMCDMCDSDRGIEEVSAKIHFGKCDVTVTCHM